MPKMQNHSDLNEWLAQRAQLTCHRQLVLISAPQDWSEQQAENILACVGGQGALWIGQRQSGQAYQAIDTYRQFLGHEYPTLVYNAFSGLRANALMALSGTVKSNGLMLLLCPEEDHWPSYPDPQRSKRISYGFDASGTDSQFIHWMQTKLAEDTNVVRLTPNGFSGPLLEVDKQSLLQASTECPNQDQAGVLQEIINLRSRHRKRPLVISADRGRGKSSILGLAAAKLILNGSKHISVTAPHFSAVDQVFRHATMVLGHCEIRGKSLYYQDAILDFMPVDRLIESHPQRDLILVDEAAAIPAPALLKLLKFYRRIVFSTTVHGYEGSGRGFELRFKAHLNEHFPGWKHIQLSSPVRWYQNDPLEAFWFTAMCMHGYQAKNEVNLSNAALSNARTELLSAEGLRAHPEKLNQIFSLLVDAHYKTTPDDLLKILDAPEQQVLCVLAENSGTNRVIAVCLLSTEGGARLDTIARDIQAGKRRVPGHLVPQTLSLSYHNQQAATLLYLRVVRIAVLPALQHKGIGSKLLAAAKQHGIDKQYDVLCASFGATSQLINFWSASQFSPIRLGSKSDASSGENSLVMAQDLNNAAITCLKTLQDK